MSYLVFLVLFTYVLMGKLNSTPSTAEIILIIFVISLTTEEIRQVVLLLFQFFIESSQSRLTVFSTIKPLMCFCFMQQLYPVAKFIRFKTKLYSSEKLYSYSQLPFWRERERLYRQSSTFRVHIAGSYFIDQSLTALPVFWQINWIRKQ